MTNAIEHDLNWQGPFSLLHPDPDSCFDCPAANEPGVYLWAFKYRDGYLIYGAGLTAKRTLAKRLKEDSRSFTTGEWTILDAGSAEQGVRKERWHGMWAGYTTGERQQERLSRAGEIELATKDMLARMRVFLGPLPPEQRVIERVEAAIMDKLYPCGPPFSKLPDVGMSLRPRRATERPITIRSHAPVVLHCIPDRLEV